MTLNVLESTKRSLLSFKFRALSNLLFFYEPLIGPQPTFFKFFWIKSVPGYRIVASQNRLVGYYRFKSAFLHFKTIFLLKN